jgi:hypothetical protein
MKRRFTEGADHRDPARAGGRRSGQGDRPSSWDLGAELLSLEGQVRRMEVPDARRLRELKAENGKLKRLLAEAHLDNAALKDVLGRKW